MKLRGLPRRVNSFGEHGFLFSGVAEIRQYAAGAGPHAVTAEPFVLFDCFLILPNPSFVISLLRTMAILEQLNLLPHPVQLALVLLGYE